MYLYIIWFSILLLILDRKLVTETTKRAIKMID